MRASSTFQTYNREVLPDSLKLVSNRHYVELIISSIRTVYTNVLPLKLETCNQHRYNIQELVKHQHLAVSVNRRSTDDLRSPMIHYDRQTKMCQSNICPTINSSQIKLQHTYSVHTVQNETDNKLQYAEN